MDLPRHCRDGLRGPSASFQMHFLVFMLFSGFLLVAADTGLRSRFWSLGGSLYPAWRVAAGGYRRHSLLHFAQRRPDCPNLSQRWLFASWTTYRLRGLAQSAGFSLWHHLWARLHPDRQVPTGSSQRRALFHLSPRWQYHTDLPRCHSKCKRSLCVFLVRVVWGYPKLRLRMEPATLDRDKIGACGGLPLDHLVSHSGTGGLLTHKSLISMGHAVNAAWFEGGIEA